MSGLVARLVAAGAGTIADHARELTALHPAIGDGDHGLNMARGFGALSAAGGEIAALDFGQALQNAGMTLVMKVGGASGPLYGSALMAMGKAAPAAPAARAEVVAMLAAGIDAIRARGRSDVGAKTMLDVLVPVLAAIDAGADPAGIRAAADAALEATRPMRATKGRAAFLGDRSIGHLDPGARSSALLVHAALDVVEGKDRAQEG